LEAVSTEAAPKAIGPYSQAVYCGNFLFCSGQLGLNASDGELVSGGVAQQADRALRNLAAVLQAASLGLGDVVKTTVFLTTMDDFAPMNQVYAEYFTGVLPARSTIAVAALPKDALVEIEAIAASKATPAP